MSMTYRAHDRFDVTGAPKEHAGFLPGDIHSPAPNDKMNAQEADSRQAGGEAMTRFYDASDESDLRRVERILKRGGIEYFLKDVPGPGPGLGGREIHVAEEDFAAAEQLILEETRH
jgi:Putative prokaryotic signal transducing protein